MRKARDFVVTFDPRSFEEFMAGLMGPGGSYIRQVLGYWDMAASLVLNGAIDTKMFLDANNEHVLVFGRVEPYLPQIRAAFKNPDFLKSLEQLCLSMPDARNRIDTVRELIRGFLAQRAADAAASS